MKKRPIISLLCAGLVAVLLVGCQGTGKQSDSEAKSTDEKEETMSSGNTAEEKKDEFNEYGLTDEQQEALLTAVEASVKEGYLEKHNISVSDFKLLPYDANDLNNYDYTGEYIGSGYSGEDPYECALLWYVMDKEILGMDVAVSLGQGFAPKETLEEQNQQENGPKLIFDTSSEHYDLQNAVYAGIAKFLNGLEDQERAEVLHNLYKIVDSNSEDVTINRNEVGMTVKSAAMFDKVISENIRFE